VWLQWQGRCIVAGAWHACPPGLREALRGGGGTACASVVPWGYCCVLGRCVWGQGSYVWNFEGSRQFSLGPWLACWPRWLVFPERTFLQLANSPWSPACPWHSMAVPGPGQLPGRQGVFGAPHKLSCLPPGCQGWGAGPWVRQKRSRQQDFAPRQPSRGTSAPCLPHVPACMLALPPGHQMHPCFFPTSGRGNACVEMWRACKNSSQK
jgi:hypothetical protein